MVERIVGAIETLDNQGRVTIVIDGESANLKLGGNGKDGSITILDAVGDIILSVDDEQTSFNLIKHGEATLSLNVQAGTVALMRTVGKTSQELLRFDTNNARLNIGGEGQEGDLAVLDGSGRNAMLFDASTATLYIGTLGNEGDLIIRDEMSRTTLHFDAGAAALFIGAEGNEGDLYLRNDAGETTFKVDGAKGDITVFCPGGKLTREALRFDASHAWLNVGCHGRQGAITIQDGNGVERIRLDGGRGDIQLAGGDCAESFRILDGYECEPGTLMVIDGEETLKPCDQAYDRRVAGVISGAQGYTPGILLGKTSLKSGYSPLAVAGKVFCRVDAGYAPIQVGDLLTTSPTPGYAMKAEDPSRAFGSVIGKALGSLSCGQGLLPILVALQ